MDSAGVSIPTVLLNDGQEIPCVGLGTWTLVGGAARRAVGDALGVGYRHIDTAAAYGNEEDVGAAIRSSAVPRSDVFLTTKISNDDHGGSRATTALRGSLRRLGTDYVDLALIHWPLPLQDRYVETWDALVRLREAGDVVSIGVSNFRPDHLDRIISASGVTPAVNQVEVNPVVRHRALCEATIQRGIAVESWSPLAQQSVLSTEVVTRIAQRHDRTAAQVVLRWHLEHGYIAIPKTASHERLRENADVFSFRLQPEDLAELDALDQAAPARYTPHLAGD